MHTGAHPLGRLARPQTHHFAFTCCLLLGLLILGLVYTHRADAAGPWAKIAMGDSFMMATQSDGSLWGWGDNYSQLGTQLLGTLMKVGYSSSST
jgi:hypothetical protein